MKHEFTGSSDVHVFGLADLPEEERKRYEAMGFTVKPVERRVIKPELTSWKTPDNLKGKSKKTPNDLKNLTAKEYKRLKAEGVSDNEIAMRFACSSTTLSRWKKENGVAAIRLPRTQNVTIVDRKKN